MKLPRASVKSTLPLRERLSLKIQPSSSTVNGAQFTFNLPHPSALMSARVQLCQRFQIATLSADSNGTAIVDAPGREIFPRPGGFLRAMSQVQCTINGQSQSIRPSEVVAPFVAMGQGDRQSNYCISGLQADSYPYYAQSSQADSWKNSKWVEKNKAIFHSGGDPRPPSDGERAVPWDPSASVADYTFKTGIPLAPFSGSELSDVLSITSGYEDGVVAHANAIQLEYQFRPDALDYMLQQTMTDTAAHVFASKEIWQDRQFDLNCSAAVNQYTYNGQQVAAALIQAGRPRIKMYKPFLLVEYYSLNPIASIPPQLSVPAVSYQVFDKEFDFASNQTEQNALFQDLKFESFPSLMILYATHSEQDAGGDWKQLGARACDDYCPVDFDKLQIVQSIRSGVCSKMSRRLAYENFLQYCPPDCKITEQDFQDRRCIVAIPSELFSSPEAVYNPSTISIDATFRRPQRRIGQVAGAAYAVKCNARLICVYNTALSMSENACSLSAIRISEQAYQAALQGRAE